MEILVSALVVVANWVINKLGKKFGLEMGRALTLIVAFLLSGVAALIYVHLDPALWQKILQVFAIQMAIYEVFIKNTKLAVEWATRSW